MRKKQEAGNLVLDQKGYYIKPNLIVYFTLWVTIFVLTLPPVVVYATPVTQTNIESNVDWTSAGVGGVGGGAGTIDLTGVGGTVLKAFLIWHGIDNSGAGAEYDNDTVAINGNAVTGVSLGDAATNCWGAGSSRAFRADVTPFVSGDSMYTITGLSALPGHNANGASLVVIFDDGNPANNRDLIFFEGNDSNIPTGFPGEDEGWNAALAGINYEGGPVTVQLHLADGQDFTEESLTFASTGSVTIPDAVGLYDGDSVPTAGTSRTSDGELWDIHTFDITDAFGTPGLHTLTMSGLEDAPGGVDCLGLVLLLMDFESTCGNGVLDEDEQCDLGTANGTAGACCTASCTLVPADTTCRPSAGACDIAESCTGTDAECPADSKSTSVCRPSAGVCDVAENCDGVTDACPSDGFASSDTVCRPSADQCDAAENCTGTSAACPADGFQPNGTTCNDGNASTSGDVCTNGVCAGDSALLTLSAPNGSEIWSLGSKQLILWNPAGVSGKVKLEFSSDGGATWTVLFNNVTNDGERTWTVSGAPTTQALVRVSSMANPGIGDVSNAVFTMGGGSVTVLTPNGGETWPVGSKQTVQWSSSGINGKVKVELSRDGGTTWTVLDDSATNTGKLTWRVKGPATTQARVRVSGVNDSGAVDTSNANFTIQ